VLDLELGKYLFHSVVQYDLLFRIFVLCEHLAYCDQESVCFVCMCTSEVSLWVLPGVCFAAVSDVK